MLSIKLPFLPNGDKNSYLVWTLAAQTQHELGCQHIWSCSPTGSHLDLLYKELKICMVGVSQHVDDCAKPGSILMNSISFVFSTTDRSGMTQAASIQLELGQIQWGMLC